MLEIGPAEREAPGERGRRAYSHELPNLALNYGVWESGQASMGLPVILLDEPGSDPDYNLGDLARLQAARGGRA